MLTANMAGRQRRGFATQPTTGRHHGPTWWHVKNVGLCWSVTAGLVGYQNDTTTADMTQHDNPTWRPCSVGPCVAVFTTACVRLAISYLAFSAFHSNTSRQKMAYKKKAQLTSVERTTLAHDSSHSVCEVTQFPPAGLPLTFAAQFVQPSASW